MPNLTNQTTLHTAINTNNTTQQQKKAEDDRPASAWDTIKNTASQAYRTLGGVAQGFVKTIAAPGVAAESSGLYRPGQNQRAVAEFNKQSIQDGTVQKPMTETADKINTGIQNWTDSWVPPPQSGAAEFVAKASDALGEAVPAVATAVATGGASASSVLAGNVASWTAGAANAYSTEMLEGSGDSGRALLSGATEFGAEAIGGKLFNAAAKNIANPVASWAVNSVGEGLEENISGFAQAALTGEKYTASQALEEFALGATVGAAVGAGISGVNAASAGIKKARVQHDVNARISNVAKADVNDVKSLLAHGNDSGASAVIAQDSLAAIQKQVANPINAGPQQTSAIPANIAEKYGLRMAESGENPLVVTVKNSYEGLVEPTVSQLAAPEVSLTERASIDPNNVDAETLANPRAVYKYAQEDIYLKPGTDVDNSLFTYRGQANQFYRSGSFIATGAGVSNEGSGVYSATTPYTTDLYGPTAKLADNPYINQGIRRKAVESDYPIGVVTQQSPNLNEIRSPLERKSQDVQKRDFQNNTVDVVPEGERRVRYDNRGIGLITEVINNPNDVKAAGLIFGRTSIADATPIQYASDNTRSNSSNESNSVQSDAAQKSTKQTNSEQSATIQQLTQESPTDNTAHKASTESRILTEESATGEYVVPNLINTREITANFSDEGTTEQKGEDIIGQAISNSWNDAIEGRNPVNNPGGPTEDHMPAETRAPERSHTPTEAANAPIVPENPATTTAHETPASPNTPTTNLTPSSSPESPSTNVPPEIPTPSVPSETPKSTSTPIETPPPDTEAPSTSPRIENPPKAPTGKREVNPEETPAHIWTPIQVMEQANSNISYTDRDEKLPTYDFSLLKGPGSRGQVYETTGYNSTFGGLSSY